MTVKVELLHRNARTALKPPRVLQHDEWPPNYEEVLLWRQAQLARYEVDPEFLQNARAFYAKNCLAFILHWCDTFDPRNAGTDKPTWMPFILFQRQAELVEFVLSLLKEEQPGLVEKSRDMGATWLCVAISVWAWLFIPGIQIGWGTQDQDKLAVIGDPSSIFEKLRLLVRRIPEVFLPSAINETDETNDRKNLKGKQIINPDNGASIIGQIGDNIGRGARTRIYFKDEAAHYQHAEAIDAALSMTTRVPIDISSVNGLGNLFYRKREAGLDWYPGAVLPRGKVRVFVLDWQENPLHTREWYEQTKQYWEDIAAPHVFAAEVDRNYAAAVQNTIIPKEWLDSCIDAHLRLKISEGGNKISALDIGDSADGDRNAQSVRSGIVLTYADEWVAKDPGVTARRAISNCIDQQVPELQYDAGGGLGSNVKSEVNRLEQEKAMPANLRVVPWNPGGKVLRPADRVVPSDQRSPRNKDFYTNLKAQAWWEFRARCYRTHTLIQALKKGGKLLSGPDDPEVLVLTKKGETLRYSVDDLVSLDKRLKLLHKITKELCQATSDKGARLKLLVEKAPEGTRSPNIADSIIMAYWPAPYITGDFVEVGMGPKVFIGGASLE